MTILMYRQAKKQDYSYHLDILHLFAHIYLLDVLHRRLNFSSAQNIHLQSCNNHHICSKTL